MGYHLRFCILFFVAFVFAFLPALSEGAPKSYYYLHVASFRSNKNATESVRYLKKHRVNTVIRKEPVPNMGDWYRVYVGPFSTRQEAESTSRELKRKKAIEYASIKQSEGLISSEPAAVRAQPPPVVLVPAAKPAPVTPKPAVQKPSPTVQPQAKKPEPAPAAAKGKKKKEPKRPTQRQNGRNTPGGSLSVGLKYTYTETDTWVTLRKPTDFPDDSQRDNFPTTMKLGTAVIRYGVTDWFEVFGEIGASYDESISDSGLAYGGGLRFNLFQTSSSEKSAGFYGALQGEYFQGSFEDEFTSTLGNPFQKETKWQEFTAKAELGLRHRRFALYAGGTYLYYREETDRRQLNGTTFYSDELENLDDFGAYGGFTFYFTPDLLLNIEARGFDQTAFSGALEYRF